MTRGDVWLVALDPTQGSEIRKTRPSLVISPDEMNRHLRTVIVAPMTTQSRPAPFRMPIVFGRKRGLVVLEQLRSIDKTRLLRRLGRASPNVVAGALGRLQGMFAE